jgi:hypothetical protein
MDAARQVLRFSIPGSAFLLLTYLFLIGGRLIEDDTLAGVAAAVDGNVAAVAVILASIPVGFILYQFYYLSVQPFVRVLFLTFERRWPRIDRGARVFAALGLEELEAVTRLFGVAFVVEAEHQSGVEGRAGRKRAGSLIRRSSRRGPSATLNAENRGTVDAPGVLEWLGVQKLSPEFLKPWPDIDPKKPHASESYAKAADVYEDRWRTNWDVLRALLDAAEDFPGGPQLRGEYGLLSDVYHALGACRTACTAAWLASSGVVVTYLLTDHRNGVLRGLAAIGASGVVALALWLVLNQTRRQTWKSAERSLTYGLRYFLVRNPQFLDPRPPTA